MSISLYYSCIEELEIPPNKKRKLNIISGYLKSLKNFMLLLNNQKDNNKQLLDKISSIMKLRKLKKYELILNEGEKGKEFFILLKGKINVLTPKINEYYMSVEEYISYLFQLRLKEQNELIHKCISLNQNIYPIDEENFDSFVFNLSEGKTINEFYSKKNNLILKSKKIVQYILEEKNKLKLFTNKNIDSKKEIILSPEEYIIQNSVPEDVIKNTLFIQNYLSKLESDKTSNIDEKNNESIDEKDENDENKNKKLLNNRNKLYVPSHEIFGDLEIGSYFGEMPLEEKGSGKRHATLIAIEESYIGVIDKNDYYMLLHVFIEKSQNKYINFISSFYIFKNLSLNVWEKKYMSLFINRVYEKDYLLLKEGNPIDQIYFIYKGEFELTTSKNLIELNELIIYYKKILRELLYKNKNNINREMIKFCDYKEEIKQNESFIMNKKFGGDKLKQMIFEKKVIKIGILSTKEIIGLLDIYSSTKFNKNDLNKESDIFGIKKYKMSSLYNCKCISCNCEVYSFPLNTFKQIIKEDKVGNLTNEIEIKKIYYIIKRLKHYIEFLFESLYLKEIDKKKAIKKMKNKSVNKGIKNKFIQMFEYSNFNFKKGVFNNNFGRKKKLINGYFTERKLSNSYSNYIPTKTSYDKYKNKNITKSYNWANKTNYKFIKNNERLKIKQKFLGLPIIDGVGKNKEKENNITNEKTTTRLNTENDTNNYSQKLKTKIILLPKKEENQENNKIDKMISTDNNDNTAINNFSQKRNNSKNSFVNLDKINFRKKPLINNYNWVKKVLVKNIVYNHIFDKFAFSNIKNSRNNINTSKSFLKNNLKTSEESEKLKIIDNNSKDKMSLIKSSDKYYNKNYIKDETKSNTFTKKINKSSSNINKMKNMKMEYIENNKNKNNGIYDALIFDTFNKHFNENIYNKFLEE